MSRNRRLFVAVCLAAAVAVGAVLAVPAQAGTFVHYGPPNTAAGWLLGHSVSGGAGTQPTEYPGPHPWDMAAGDYCTAYKFAQPAAPDSSAPLGIASGVNIGALTGFDPGTPRTHYQLRHTLQADSSACQAKGATWGFWVNANTADNFCSKWCGVRHDYSTGASIGTRPWANGYGSGSKLVMGATRHVQTYSAQLGWSYLCAMLQDTTTGQRLEYCFRVWRSWSGGTTDAPIVFRNPYIGSGTGFSTVVTDLTDAGTAFGQNFGGAQTVLGTVPSTNTYTGAITRTHLVNAVNSTNAVVKSQNLGTCLGLNGVRCYSADPNAYALMGFEDGLEILGTGAARMGGNSSGLTAYTDY